MPRYRASFYTAPAPGGKRSHRIAHVERVCDNAAEAAAFAAKCCAKTPPEILSGVIRVTVEVIDNG